EDEAEVGGVAAEVVLDQVRQEDRGRPLVAEEPDRGRRERRGQPALAADEAEPFPDVGEEALSLSRGRRVGGDHEQQDERDYERRRVDEERRPGAEGPDD